jgi:hypothetical protein
MPSLNLSNWLNAPRTPFNIPIDHAWRAGRNWLLIQRDPISITVDRAGTQLPAQTVRFAYPKNDEIKIDVDTRTEKLTVTIYGVKDHAVIADTDLQQGDRFWIDGLEYEVRAVTPTPGGLEALADAKG